ncbi:MAG: 5-formyltetrahydrofolate cyclo-ligase [Eubacteriales bacterium]|nr:5-formyltetrahydrofolate cyclo-ligase [Eubacteriales bacterium]
MSDKLAIRKLLLEKRSALSPEVIEKAGQSAAEKLILMKEYSNANTVMVYMDFRNEVPTGKIIDQIRLTGKCLVLPFTDERFCIIPYEIPEEGALSDYLIPSAYGIFEPNPAACRKVDPESIDLVVIPGSAFDQYENRMGYGKGCYDRFLPTLRPDAFKLALAYDFQVVSCIPAGRTDVKMDKILTIMTMHP